MAHVIKTAGGDSSGLVRMPGTGASAPAAEALQAELEELGLSPYEARVLLALLRVGSARSSELARASGVHRTSTYQVLDSLAAKGLVERLPGDGPAVWASVGHDQVLERLRAALAAAQEERLRQHEERSARVAHMLTEVIPHPRPVALPYVHVVTCDAQIRSRHEALLAAATSEVLVFNRPPYAEPNANLAPLVAAACARGVSMRILYQDEQFSGADGLAFGAAVQAYEALGANGKVVDALPVKLSVIDRRHVLLGMAEPFATEDGFPTTLWIEHRGAAEAFAATFEHYWSIARCVGAPDAVYP